MKIPQNVIEELIVQAQKDAPDESCGYLLGIISPSTGGGQGEALVTENYWMENTDHSPEHFSFAPKDQFADWGVIYQMIHSGKSFQPASAVTETPKKKESFLQRLFSGD